MRVWLAYVPRRVKCCDCGVRTEPVSWAFHGSRFSSDFEELVAYLAQGTDKTKVTELMGIAWASRSKLKPLVKAARTIRKHVDGVLAYFQARMTNGIAEGFNNKLRMIARRAFGFHSPPPLIALLYLCSGGITLDPPIPRPT